MPNPSRTRFLLISLVVVIGLSTACVSVPTKHEAIVMAALSEAAVYLDRGQFKEAAGIYLPALQKVPDDVRLLYNLSLAQAQAKNFELATATITKLVRLFPANIKYLKAKAAILCASGASLEACKTWEQVLRLDPYDLVVRLLLANQYFIDSEFSLSKTHALALYQRGQYSRELYILLGKLQQAMGEGDGTSWVLLADAYFPNTPL